MDFHKVQPSWAYAALQMQCSFEVLIDFERRDEKLREKVFDNMEVACDCADYYLWESKQSFNQEEVTKPVQDWRKYPLETDGEGYRVPCLDPEVARGSFSIRNSTEAALVRMMNPRASFGYTWRALFHEMLLRPDYSRHCTYAILYPQAAYWRALKCGLIESGQAMKLKVAPLEKTT